MEGETAIAYERSRIESVGVVLEKVDRNRLGGVNSLLSKPVVERAKGLRSAMEPTSAKRWDPVKASSV